MRHAAAGCMLTLCLAVLPAGPAFSQNASSAVSSAATAAASDVAHVYVGTHKGVYLYHAASNGKLTLVSGSAFKITGTIASTQLWVDGLKLDSTASNSLDASISLSAGAHRFAIVTSNTAGKKWESAVNATVK